MSAVLGMLLMREEGPEAAPGQCRIVGEAMPDIAGIGILVGFIGQAIMSLILAAWVFFFSKHGNLDHHHKEGSLQHELQQRRLEAVSEILMVGNDIQMILGSSYMITIFAQVDTIDLYHLHLAFDIVSFVGVSNAAALVCWTFCNVKLPPRDPEKHKTSHTFRAAHWTARHRATYLFAAMFAALTILVCLRLDEWNLDDERGRCYDGHLVTRPNASHPFADRVYIIVTAVWMILCMLAAALSGARWRRPILVSAFLQFPVHLYMALALRGVNQDKLTGEESENGWDFGQTTAIILLSMAFGELFQKSYEFFKFERRLKKEGITKTLSGPGSNHVRSRSRIQSPDDIDLEEEAQEGTLRGSRSGGYDPGAYYDPPADELAPFAKPATAADARRSTS